MDEAIERREERHAIGNLGAAHIGVSLHRPSSAAPRVPGSAARRARGRPRARTSSRSADTNVGEIPQPLLSLSTGDRDEAVGMEDLEHQRDLTAAPPAMRLVRPRGRLVLELARRHRSVVIELAQDIALEARVLDEELGAPTLVRVAPTAPAPPHPRPPSGSDSIGQMYALPLEELPLVPQQAVELRNVVHQSTPEHELLRRRDGRDRVDLEETGPLTVSRTLVAEPSRSCARTAIRRASFGDTTLTMSPGRVRGASERPPSRPTRAPRRCGRNAHRASPRSASRAVQRSRRVPAPTARR